MKDTSVEILSGITVFTKYSRYQRELGRRETWEELVNRNRNMHLRKLPKLEQEINAVYDDFVIPKRVLPSMRSLQFGGAPIEIAPNRVFNCAYAPADHPDVFSEAMFLLLGGTGLGYSVQRQHVRELPAVQGPSRESRRYLVADSIEGWADAVKILVEAHFYGKAVPMMDYTDIREKGAELITTGGKAPGPAPLKTCIEKLDALLHRVVAERGRGAKLTTLETHDMLCYIADAVLTGGIRRAALISLFSMDDQDMLNCKAGAWWEENPQRGRANNSAVILRHLVKEKDFKALWEAVEASGSGEPGVYFSNNPDWGSNPCCEISLRPFQFCNLTELNVSDVVDQEDLNARSKAAAFIGTLQASYTDFHYLRPEWRAATEKEALLGVGMTGIASGAVESLDLLQAADAAVAENKRVAKLLGINAAARVTAVKPAGTSSLVLGSSSGIHAWHNDYYIRRMRVGKNESIYKYLSVMHPELVQDEHFNPETQAVIEVPQKAPEGATLRTEKPLDLLERVKRWNLEWVRQGHVDGQNTNNVSCTISVKEDEWELVGEWMWNNRNFFNGISVLPYDGGTYIQAPFEDITAEEYAERSKSLTGINLKGVQEDADYTDLQGELACSGGACEII